MGDVWSTEVAPDYEFKFLVVGNYSMFSNYLSQLAAKIYNLDGRTVKVMICYAKSQLGQSELQTISSSYYNRFDGIIIAYDLTSQASFDDSQRWLEKINRYASGNVCKLLVGAKGSMSDRMVEYSTGKTYADKQQIPFAEIPQIVAEKILMVFEKIVDDAFWNMRKRETEQQRNQPQQEIQ